MDEAVFAVPGDLAAPTGGYAYARRLLELLPAHGIRAAHLRLPGSFPFPSVADLAETGSFLSRLPEGVPLLVDGLAYGALPAQTIRAAVSRPIVALVHHPLGLETGLARDCAAALVVSERAALALADRVIATSPFTARILAAGFGVPEERLRVIPPGTEPARRVESRPGPGTRLLAVGAVTPRKGYDRLVDALAGLAELEWRLTIVGTLDRDPGHVEALRKSIAAASLGSRIRLAGAVTEAGLHRLYEEADVVVSSSLFEGYGMVLTEALARGLPLVVAAGGAAAETAPDDATLKVPAGDVGALAEAIRVVVGDPDGRRVLAEAAWEAGRNLPRWDDTASAVAAVLREPTT
ncbi:glycosyltransferase family 4 protein [Enterovirga rhinocerotis]|uniref:Glycosyl transferase family 4 n=1 Tax=Enterovirga rhinocerotis TaxID=1339210 RepID=A0A4R7BTE9_9HYPH|nr:glycosyltransferase family 4 protein [Enterovirga rhinocerotis]TDR89024.1 glycosyl transferase family 4 [Enterovirga rhinocerotis]